MTSRKTRGREDGGGGGKKPRARRTHEKRGGEKDRRGEPGGPNEVPSLPGRQTKPARKGRPNCRGRKRASGALGTSGGRKTQRHEGSTANTGRPEIALGNKWTREGGKRKTANRQKSNEKTVGAEAPGRKSPVMEETQPNEQTREGQKEEARGLE